MDTTPKRTDFTTTNMTLDCTDHATLWIDLESTGLSTRNHGLYQVSGQLGYDGEPFDFLMKPREHCQFNKQAMDISAYTEYDMMSFPNQADAFKQFLAIVKAAIHTSKNNRRKLRLGGYNVSALDRRFLTQWFTINHERIDDYILGKAHDNDVLPKVRKYTKAFGTVTENHKLMTVAEALGIEISPEEAHKAQYDIDITIKVNKVVEADIAKLKRQYRELAGTSTAEEAKVKRKLTSLGVFSK